MEPAVQSGDCLTPVVCVVCVVCAVLVPNKGLASVPTTKNPFAKPLMVIPTPPDLTNSMSGIWAY
jgi:hypothetical protein